QNRAARMLGAQRHVDYVGVLASAVAVFHLAPAHGGPSVDEGQLGSYVCLIYRRMCRARMDEGAVA
ncbi:hypothetical protein TI06_23435, partial [Vibrio vulnificus]